jgi:hypothetical protein
MGKFVSQCFLVLGILALAACGEGKDRLAGLNGNWSVDTIASMEMPENKPGNIFERALTEGILGMTSMEMDAPNKRMTISKGLIRNTYAFELVSAKGNIVTIRTVADGKEITFEIKDDNTIIYRDDSADQTPMVMSRKK